MNPELSIIIPLHNQAVTITAALDTCAAQHMDMEILVVDDASTDDSAERVRCWSATHSEVPLRILRSEQQGYALRSLLDGLAAASAPDILFMDGDDRLVGSDALRRVLNHKKVNGCELSQFRTEFTSQEGKEEDEFPDSIPLGHDVLRGTDIFAATAARQYPPLQIWGKIYSHDLLERVIPHTYGRTLYHLDGQLLVSLCLLLAHSYVGCSEYAYCHKSRNMQALTTFSGCVHDLLALQDTLEPLFNSGMATQEAARKFRQYLRRQLSITMSNACIELDRRLCEGEPPEKLLAELTSFLESEQLLPMMLIAATDNAMAVRNTLERIFNAF